MGITRQVLHGLGECLQLGCDAGEGLADVVGHPEGDGPQNGDNDGQVCRSSTSSTPKQAPHLQCLRGTAEGLRPLPSLPEWLCVNTHTGPYRLAKGLELS